ncbi:DNA cytosine methyltransferase [Enterococcus termitis]
MPKENQLEEPDPKKKGMIFKKFIQTLERLGYEVEFRILKACDYGTPTTRKRLFLIARSDGEPIVLPEATHGPRDSQEVQEGKLLPYRAAKEVIDFSLESKSIFNRDKPLKESTMKRIARGLKKFVVENNDPFLTKAHKSDQSSAGIPSFIQMGYGDPEGKRVLDLNNPFGTITSGGNKFGLATAWIKEDYGQSTGTDINKPLGTITAKSNHHSLMTVFLSKHYGGNYKGAGIDLRDPMDTITQVDHHSLVSAKLQKISTQVKSDKELIRVSILFPHCFIVRLVSLD